MNFFVTPARRASLARAGGCFAIALIVGAAGFLYTVDSLGLILGLIIVATLVLVGVFHLRRASQASPTDYVTCMPDLASVPEQVRYFRQMFWNSAFAFPLLTGWVAYDLHRLETGADKAVRIWGPLVPICENFGYWPTIVLQR